MKIKYKPWAKGLMYLVEAVVIILSVFPILWVVMSSFKTNGEILSSPLALPAHFSLDTFIEIFQKYSFPTYFFNSLLAAGVCVCAGVGPEAIRRGLEARLPLV